jgi:hypothetical protein
MANIYQCFDGQKGGFEPLANVAYRMEISQVSGDLDADVLDKAGVSTMLFLGFVEVNTDRTRDVVDDLRNKIDWAILDEDDGFVISDGGVDPEMVFYMALFCIRIASYVDDRGTERNFVMFLEPVDLESSM